MSSHRSASLDIALKLGAASATIIAAAQLRRFWWAAKKRSGKRNAPPLPEDGDLVRVGFSAKKVPQDIDHVIVGSGLSGLYLGSLLSKLGRRVLILEQHYVAGGCTHTFKDQGFEFDTGVHYVGQATQLQAMMDFGAGRQGAFTMRRSGAEDGTNVYNEIHVGGKAFRFRPGRENFIQDLVAKFPEEEVAIRSFFREVLLGVAAMGLVTSKQMVPGCVWNSLLAVPGPARWLKNRYVERTLAQVLEDTGVKDDYLKAVLSAEFGDYGVLPEECPFFLHAVILFHYIWEGGFYPDGGSDAFATALVPEIFAAGGSVMVRAPVTKIIVEGGRAIGVEVKGKHVIKAKHSVISAAGAEVTYRKLLSEIDVQKIGGPPQSVCATEKKGVAHHVYGFIGLQGSSQELGGLPTYNIWSFPMQSHMASPSLNAVWKFAVGAKGKVPAFLDSEKAASEAELACFISFPSAKEPGYNSRNPGKSTAVVLTESRIEHFKPGPVSKRGAHYDDLKAKYKVALVNAFLRHFPHLKDKIAYVDIATPASNEHYLGRASSYGLDQDAARFLDPTLTMSVPRIRGLYLTGQDFLTCGVFAQPIVAWITMSKVVGVTSLDFWCLLGDFLLAVVKRSLFSPGPTSPGIRELCNWLS